MNPTEIPINKICPRLQGLFLGFLKQNHLSLVRYILVGHSRLKGLLRVLWSIHSFTPVSYIVLHGNRWERGGNNFQYLSVTDTGRPGTLRRTFTQNTKFSEVQFIKHLARVNEEKIHVWCRPWNTLSRPTKCIYLQIQQFWHVFLKQPWFANLLRGNLLKHGGWMLKFDHGPCRCAIET